MSAKAKNPTLREFAKYVSSSVIAMIGLSCYVLADTFFISLDLGDTGLAALNFASPSFSLVFALGMLFGVGGATRFAIHKGAKETESGNRVFTHTVVAVGCFAIVFVLVGIFLNGQVASLLGANGETFDLSKTYVRIILCFAPFFMYNIVFQNFVRNDGGPRLAMIATFSGNVFNIVFDYILIFPAKLHMLGAALATGFSPIVSILILSIFVFRKKNTFKLTKTKPSLRVLGGMAKLGLASFIAECSFGVVMLVFNKLFDRIGTTTAVAAYGIVVNVYFVVNAIFNGIATGTQPMISFSHGEGDRKKIRTVLKYGLITTACAAALIYLALFFGAEGIAGIFNMKGSLQVQNIATQGIRLYFVSALFAGFNLLFSSFFAASDKGLCSQTVTLLKGLVAVIPLALVFSHFWGMTGLWLATPVAELVTLAVSVAMYFATQRKLAYCTKTQLYVRE
ncbi:MAG: MATE family efflux transporter [Christensenellales bacterium]